MSIDYGWLKLTTQQAADFAAIKQANPSENYIPVFPDNGGDKWISVELLLPTNWATYPLYTAMVRDIYEAMVESSSAGQIAAPTWPPPPDI